MWCVRQQWISCCRVGPMLLPRSPLITSCIIATACSREVRPKCVFSFCISFFGDSPLHNSGLCPHYYCLPVLKTGLQRAPCLRYACVACVLHVFVFCLSSVYLSIHPIHQNQIDWPSWKWQQPVRISLSLCVVHIAHIRLRLATRAESLSLFSLSLLYSPSSLLSLLFSTLSFFLSLLNMC